MPHITFNHTEIKREFTEALRSRHLVLSGDLVDDGSKHRCDASNKENGHGKNDGEYVLHTDGWPAGAFINYTDGQGWKKWKHTSDVQLSPGQRAQLARQSSEARARGYKERREKAEEAKQQAIEEWNAARPAKSKGDYVPFYLSQKNIQPHGTRQSGRRLLVPVCSPKDRKLISLQTIHPGGSKRFTKGSRVAGGYFRIKVADENSKTTCIGESFSTCATIKEDTSHQVYSAFSAGNLLAVARMVRKRHPDHTIILCADDDWKEPGNPGLTKAKEAARAVGGLVAIPKFGEGRSDKQTDFNDLHVAKGHQAVKRCIEDAKEPEEDNVSEEGVMNKEERGRLLDELAKLDRFEYDRRRKAAAKQLGLSRVKVLDIEVAAFRELQVAGEFMAPVEPWLKPVNGDALLTELVDALYEHVVVSKHSYTTII